MNHITPFTSLNDSCPEREILDMIFNKAPYFMRSGGGPIERQVGFSGQALPERVEREMRRRVARGDDMRDVASHLGVHYATVVKKTHDIRTARRAITSSSAQEVAA